MPSRAPGVRILSVVGARPNLVKLAPVVRALASRPVVEHLVVHTGQHYDASMSGTFFEELEIPAPHANLEVGSGTHAQQTAAVLERFEPICRDTRPDWVLVYGDVNSTVAAALVAAKLGVRVAHVEAGLRSYDRTMPEEHNRVVTDHLSDLLFAPSRDAVNNLLHEGIAIERLSFVGNVMIDTLVRVLSRARALCTASRLGVAIGQFALVTLHRPANVDNPKVFLELCDGLAEIHRHMPVVFPIHPRSRARLREWDTVSRLADVCLVNPLPYAAMLDLIDTARLVITDSGGVQEESTFLGVPCLTVRPNTERPITITEGTNRLVPATRDELVEAALGPVERRVPAQLDRWDGRASERLVAVLCEGKRFD